MGAQPFQGRELAFRLGLTGVQVKQFVTIFMGLAKLFADKDLALIEVNPLVITSEGNLHCLDAKLVVDGNAVLRHPDLADMYDPTQEDERERRRVGRPAEGLQLLHHRVWREARQ